jgi:hypothetical protein
MRTARLRCGGRGAARAKHVPRISPASPGGSWPCFRYPALFRAARNSISSGAYRADRCFRLLHLSKKPAAWRIHATGCRADLRDLLFVLPDRASCRAIQGDVSGRDFELARSSARVKGFAVQGRLAAPSIWVRIKEFFKSAHDTIRKANPKIVEPNHRWTVGTIPCSYRWGATCCGAQMDRESNLKWDLDRKAMATPASPPSS